MLPDKIVAYILQKN